METKELMCECGHAEYKHGPLGCVVPCPCMNIPEVFDARRVAGQWYRRALKAESGSAAWYRLATNTDKENAALKAQLAELEGRLSRTCDYFNAIREKYQIESGVMFGDWIDEQVAQLAAANERAEKAEKELKMHIELNIRLQDELAAANADVERLRNGLAGVMLLADDYTGNQLERLARIGTRCRKELYGSEFTPAGG